MPHDKHLQPTSKEELAEDDDVRVVVLTSDGYYYSAGADIGYSQVRSQKGD